MPWSAVSSTTIAELSQPHCTVISPQGERVGSGYKALTALAPPTFGKVHSAHRRQSLARPSQMTQLPLLRGAGWSPRKYGWYPPSMAP